MLIPDLTVIMKLLMVIIPLALAGVAFAVTVERVQEIRDQHKYRSNCNIIHDQNCCNDNRSDHFVSMFLFHNFCLLCVLSN